MTLQEAFNIINANLSSELNLSNRNIDDNQIFLLANALKNNNSLTKIDLGNNLVSAVGVSALAKALEFNRSLNTLNLSSNHVSDAGASVLGQILKINSSLDTLNLSSNHVSDAGASALGIALEANCSLNSLILSNNKIGDVGASALGKGLETNDSLSSLDLRLNEVSDTGVLALSKAIKTNYCLSILNFRYNKISDAGASALGKALETNHSLDTLDISYNQVGDAGALALAKALEVNSSLSYLDLSFNKVGNMGALALNKALEVNHSLDTFDLSYNQVEDAVLSSFHVAWEIHQTRCELVQEAAKSGNRQKLINYFHHHQCFPPSILSLLIQHHHQVLIMWWDTDWSIAALNYRNNKGDTPLHQAIQLKAGHLIAWLLTKPVSLMRRNNRNQPLLTLLESMDSSICTDSIKEYRIGTYYLSGQKIKIDKARYYYEKASKEGYKPATWLLHLLDLLENGIYIESVVVDQLIRVTKSLPQLTFTEVEVLIFSLTTPEGKLLSVLTQQNYSLYHLVAHLGFPKWAKALQALPFLPINSILMKNQQGLLPSALARQQAKLVAESKRVQLNTPEAEQDEVLMRYQACEFALQKLEESTFNYFKNVLIKVLTENSSLVLLESEVINLVNLNKEQIKSLLELIATSEYKLVSALTSQDYTLYHLCALLGSIDWFEEVQLFTASFKEDLSSFCELILAKTSPQGLRASELARQQKHFIAQEKGFALDTAEAMIDKTLQRYQTCESVLRAEERKRQLDLMKAFLRGEIIIESSIMALALLDSEEIKALIEVIATPEGKLISSLTTIPTLYHLCALLGSMAWFTELPSLVEKSIQLLNGSANLILTKVGPQGLRPSEIAHQQADFIAKQKALTLKSPDVDNDITLQDYQLCEFALREAEKQAQLTLLTKFLKEKVNEESIITELATLHTKEIKDLLTIITTPEGKLWSFFSSNDYTLYHLAAYLGSPKWVKVLQKLSYSSSPTNDLLFNLILLTDQQGLRPSDIAKQQRKFIAEDKEIKLNTFEAEQDEVLMRYKACEIILRQTEEKVLLDLLLVEQRNQQQVRLDYEGRAQALKENIDLLSWQPENVSNTALVVQYAQVLQQIWSARQTCITLTNQFKKQLQWPEGFDPFALTSPGQTINQLVENSPSYRLSLQYKVQGSVVYIHYQYESAIKWLELYESTANADFRTKKAYLEGKEAFKKLINAYQNYEDLWKKAATINDKQWLRSIPVIILQVGKAPNFVSPLIAKGETLSPAAKLSYFLNKGKRIGGMAETGTSPVFSIQGVHYKRNPHAPGIEFMVSSLGKVLVGEGAVPTELLKVFGPDGIPYLYQASHTVQGKDLQSILIHHPEYIDRIHADNFAALVVLGILTDPQDGKPDNYMVEFSQDDQGNITRIDILGIDNDIAFSDVVISQHTVGEKAGQYIMNIKNVLYFLPQMMQPIGSTFRDKLLKKLPEFILLEWLQLLLVKNKEYEALLSEGIFTLIEYVGDGLANKRGLQLPIKVVEGTITRVYRKLKQLQAILNEQPKITLWNLLTIIEPEVATHYAKVKAKYPHHSLGCDVMKCIKALYEENVTNGQELMWLRDQLDKGYTHMMTTLVLKTAEEFGFEDNRITSLKNSVINVLKCLVYEDFKSFLAPILYEALNELLEVAELEALLPTALAYNCSACIYWLWQESLIDRNKIQNQCEKLKKYSLLHFFTQNKHLEGVKVLISQSIYSVNICNNQGYTPLHMAASVGDGAIVEYLVENKAYLRSKMISGETPLMMVESLCKQMNEEIPQKGDKKYADIIAYLKKANSSLQKGAENPTKYWHNNTL